MPNNVAMPGMIDGKHVADIAREQQQAQIKQMVADAMQNAQPAAPKPGPTPVPTYVPDYSKYGGSPINAPAGGGYGRNPLGPYRPGSNTMPSAPRSPIASLQSLGQAAPVAQRGMAYMPLMGAAGPRPSPMQALPTPGVQNKAHGGMVRSYGRGGNILGNITDGYDEMWRTDGNQIGGLLSGLFGGSSNEPSGVPFQRVGAVNPQDQLDVTQGIGGNRIGSPIDEEFDWNKLIGALGGAGMAMSGFGGGFAHGGPIGGQGGGQEDNIPMDADVGGFVIPADVVGHLGDGNSVEGARKLDESFGRIGYAKGGSVGKGQSKTPINISAGEYYIPADGVAQVGGGDPKAGKRKLTGLISKVRKHKKASSDLPPKAKQPDEYMKSPIG